MTPLDDLLGSDEKAVDDGVVLMTELVAAVTWLRRGDRPGLTVWDAIEEALRGRSAMRADWCLPDPLREALQAKFAEQDVPIAVALADAIRQWLHAMSHSLNEGHNW
jgi:hypothetical protein